MEEQQHPDQNTHTGFTTSQEMDSLLRDALSESEEDFDEEGNFDDSPPLTMDLTENIEQPMQHQVS